MTKTGLTLNDQNYFEMPGLNVLVYHNKFPEGHQSGVEVIQHGERTATNGELRLIPAPGQWQPADPHLPSTTSSSAAALDSTYRSARKSEI